MIFHCNVSQIHHQSGNGTHTSLSTSYTSRSIPSQLLFAQDSVVVAASPPIGAHGNRHHTVALQAQHRRLALVSSELFAGLQYHQPPHDAPPSCHDIGRRRKYKSEHILCDHRIRDYAVFGLFHLVQRAPRTSAKVGIKEQHQADCISTLQWIFRDVDQVSSLTVVWTKVYLLDPFKEGI